MDKPEMSLVRVQMRADGEDRKTLTITLNSDEEITPVLFVNAVAHFLADVMHKHGLGDADLHGSDKVDYLTGDGAKTAIH